LKHGFVRGQRATNGSNRRQTRVPIHGVSQSPPLAEKGAAYPHIGELRLRFFFGRRGKLPCDIHDVFFGQIKLSCPPSLSLRLRTTATTAAEVTNSSKNGSTVTEKPRDNSECKRRPIAAEYCRSAASSACRLPPPADRRTGPISAAFFRPAVHEISISVAPRREKTAGNARKKTAQSRAAENIRDQTCQTGRKKPPSTKAQEILIPTAFFQRRKT